MKRMQSIVVLASLFALAAPAWSGDTKLSASHVSASPQTRSQVQVKLESDVPISFKQGLTCSEFFDEYWRSLALS